MSNASRASDLHCATPHRWLVKYGFPVFLLLFVLWTPLTWFHGNITSRSTGSAIYFFTFLLGGAAIMFVAYFRFAGAIDDPSKNFVEVSADGLRIEVAGSRTLVSFAEIDSVEATRRHRLSRLFDTSNLVLKLRNVGLIELLRMSAIDGRVRLDVVESERFSATVGAQLKKPR